MILIIPACVLNVKDEMSYRTWTHSQGEWERARRRKEGRELGKEGRRETERQRDLREFVPRVVE